MTRFAQPSFVSARSTRWKPPRPTGSPPDALQGDINSATIGAALAAVQPDDAIVVLESVTSGFQYGQQSAQAPPHTTLRITGGSIGFGLPCAVGAAVACPDRKVIAFQADGSAMYTLQALWTMVRGSLDVTILVCANRTYEILRVELARAGVEDPGAAALSLTDLAHPTLDFVQLAQGMGVPATRVDTLEALVDALRRAIAEPGPQLVEAVMVPMDSRAVGV